MSETVQDGAWILIEVTSFDEEGRPSGIPLGRIDADLFDKTALTLRPQQWRTKEEAEYWLDGCMENVSRSTHMAIYLDADNLAKYQEWIGGFSEVDSMGIFQRGVNEI